MPFRVAPSALKVNPISTGPMGVSREPLHLPSTSAARAGRRHEHDRQHHDEQKPRASESFHRILLMR